ncbi:MAG: alpha-glucosidase [Myxococcota bacterium]|nr:alpha-glucosidase [Myxococcota bacterium]
MLTLFLLTSCADKAAQSVDTGTPETIPADTSAPGADPTDSGDTPDTDDTGTVEPAPSGCDAERPQDDTEDFAGQYAIDRFTVTLSAAGALSVTHDDDTPRVLFEPPADGAWLHAGSAEMTAEEHQGSFDIDEGITSRCAGLSLTQVAYGEASLWIDGGFSDCDLTFTARLCQVGEGRLSVQIESPDADYLTLRPASDADEMIFGMGEQFPHETLDLKGRIIPALSQEGGIGRGHSLITPVVELASEGSGGSEETTYYAAPHYLTSDLRSVFLEDTEYAVFDFSAAEHTEIRLFSSQMTAQVLYGDEPLALIERFTDHAGRMPALPDWVNGGAIVALARDFDESAEIVSDLLEAGAEIGGIWNQTWSGVNETYIGEQVLWNWTVGDPEGWSAWVDGLEADGIRPLCYVNSMFLDVSDRDVSRNLFAEGEAAGHFVRDADGETYMLPITAFEVALLDLTSADARDWMKTVITDEMIDTARCSGWMADFAEALPFDAQLSSGEPASSVHNAYPVQWAQLNREAIEEAGMLGEVVFFNRAGYTTTPAHSTLVWEGDQLTTWDAEDGLVSAIHGLISSGLSGVALNHSDIGGYTSLSLYGLGYDRESELLKRWAELSAFTAVMRTHEGNQPDYNAQVYDEDERDHFARMTQVYAALAFYREELFVDATERGWPLVRALWLHYPDDAPSYAVSDQFLLGSEILVAPIKNKCWTWPWCPYDKELYLPPGEWTHVWTGETYGDVAEGQTITVPADIGEPAVFYRAGSAVGAQFVSNLEDVGVL